LNRFRRKKMLGGAPPVKRWPGRGVAAPRAAREMPPTLVGLLLGSCLVVGVVLGFIWALDQQLQAGILNQRDAQRQTAEWVPLEGIPVQLRRATLLVTEPELLVSGFLRRGSGNEAIAAQLIYQVHRLELRGWGRARALMMAPILEQRLSRAGLFELYLNRVRFGESRGDPVIGIGAASRDYFGREAAELTLSESASLAGLLLEPRITDPYAAAGAVAVRRREVLDALLRGGYISAEEHAAALDEPLRFRPGRDRTPMSVPLTDPDEPEVLRLPLPPIEEVAPAEA
jgi:hypothetical protein